MRSNTSMIVDIMAHKTPDVREIKEIRRIRLIDKDRKFLRQLYGV